jgi:hypothetical protein
MQTGQNFIAPEISLPQLGQVRWGSVFMDLTVLGPQSEPETDTMLLRLSRNRPVRPLAS